MLLHVKLKKVVLESPGGAVDRNPPAIAGKQVQPLAGENSTHLGQLSLCAPAPVGLCSTTEATPRRSPPSTRRPLHRKARALHGGHSRRSPRPTRRPLHRKARALHGGRSRRSPRPTRRPLHGEACALHGGHSRRSPRPTRRPLTEKPALYTQRGAPAAMTREEPAQQEDPEGSE